MADTTVEQRVSKLEWEQEAFWRRVDEIKTTMKEHHDEDDKRFEAINERLDKLNTRFSAILASVCLLCISLLINAAVIYATRK